MTATLHKITAGDGYEYYTLHVAAHDADERGGLGLGDFYSARGESPGRWMGSGLAGLRVEFRRREVPMSVVAEGDQVTAEQMKYLFGWGMHPQGGSIQSHVIAESIAHGATTRQAVYASQQAAALGGRFRLYEPSKFRSQCAEAFTDFNRARRECRNFGGSDLGPMSRTIMVRQEGPTDVGDTGRRGEGRCGGDEEAGRAVAGPGQGTRTRSGRAGWAAQPAHQDRARSRSGSGDDRARRL